MASRNGSSRKTEEETLLSENDRMVEGLASKVSRLKSVSGSLLTTRTHGKTHAYSIQQHLYQIAVDIKQDTNNQNQFLDGMDDQFGSAGGLLKGSAQRLSQVITSVGSDRKCMCYMILGLIATFFVLYYGLGWIKT